MRMCADFAIVRLPPRNRFQFKLSQPQAERTLTHMRLRSRNIHRTPHARTQTDTMSQTLSQAQIKSLSFSLAPPLIRIQHCSKELN